MQIKVSGDNENDDDTMTIYIKTYIHTNIPLKIRPIDHNKAPYTLIKET